jgi:hypothetical protein
MPTGIAVHDTDPKQGSVMTNEFLSVFAWNW